MKSGRPKYPHASRLAALSEAMAENKPNGKAWRQFAPRKAYYPYDIHVSAGYRRKVSGEAA